MVAGYEKAVVFQSAAQTLYGLLHVPEHMTTNVGVVILVGWPQTRVGSHRQFVELARGLAAQGIACFRFDFSGMGDSTGDFPGFEDLDQDIHQAVDAFILQQPDLQRIILWGLCDGASAACFYAPQDERVVGLCLANPWVRTEQGEAEAFLKHYYVSRLISRDFWHKLLTGKLKVLSSVADLLSNVKRSRHNDEAVDARGDELRVNQSVHAKPQRILPARVFGSLDEFAGQVMCFISENDLTAAEFMDSISKERKRQKLMRSNKISMVHLTAADHTFSRRETMREVIEQTASWVKKI